MLNEDLNIKLETQHKQNRNSIIPYNSAYCELCKIWQQLGFLSA
ncbi:hypothetical protein N483_08515 [Pseudoalteromonas luteoviolacea NCIMB 1944]|nr:hypothetical protein N483_08515 [Pseudoalteromonas luteoviolacea NCIMB 1944]